MTHILHRHPLRGTLPVAVGGRGITPRRHAAARSTSTPPAAPRCRASATAIRTCIARDARADRPLAYAHTGFFTTAGGRGAGRPADRRCAGRACRTSYLVSGGSEAVEAALKLARQYFVEIGQPQRRHFIARRQSYHGNTLGALAVGGNAVAAPAIRAAADRRDARVAVLRISRPPRRRIGGSVRRAAGGGTRGRRSSASARTTSSPSSPRTVGGATAGACRRCPAISAASASSAIATASC